MSGPPAGPYTPAVVAGDLVVTSGQLGTVPGPAGPVLVEGGTVAELRQALANVEAVLAPHGAGLPQVVKATVFVTDPAAFAEVNEVWSATFGPRPPARSAVAVAALPLGASVEVEAVAYVPGAGDQGA